MAIGLAERLLARRFRKERIAAGIELSEARRRSKLAHAEVIDIKAGVSGLSLDELAAQALAFELPPEALSRALAFDGDKAVY